MIYKFITANKETYDENDFAIIEYADEEEVKLFKNLETGIYEEIRPIDWKCYKNYYLYWNLFQIIIVNFA